MAPHSSRSGKSLENPMDGGAWKALVHGVAEGQTRLSDTFIPAVEILDNQSALKQRVNGKVKTFKSTYD